MTAYTRRRLTLRPEVADLVAWQERRCGWRYLPPARQSQSQLGRGAPHTPPRRSCRTACQCRRCCSRRWYAPASGGFTSLQRSRRARQSLRCAAYAWRQRRFSSGCRCRTILRYQCEAVSMSSRRPSGCGSPRPSVATRITSGDRRERSVARPVRHATVWQSGLHPRSRVKDSTNWWRTRVTRIARPVQNVHQAVGSEKRIDLRLHGRQRAHGSWAAFGPGAVLVVGTGS